MRTSKDYAADVVRWIARILGTLLFILVMVFVIGDAGSFGGITWQEQVLFFLFAIMVVGLPIAWYAEMIGGLMTIGGFVGFWLAEFILSGQIIPELAFVVFPLVGVLFLFTWWRDEQTKATP